MSTGPITGNDSSNSQGPYVPISAIGQDGPPTFDPGAVQTQIMGVFSQMKAYMRYHRGEELPPIFMTQIFYLVGQYGEAKVGQTTEIQASLNPFNALFTDLTTQVNAACGYVGPSAQDPSIKYKEDLTTILEDLKTCGAFTTGMLSSLAPDLSAVATTLLGYVNSASGNGSGYLENLWKEMTGSGSPTAANYISGNPSVMTPIQTQIAQGSQLTTRLGATVSTVISTYTSLNSSEMDMLNNWMKKLNSFITLIEQQKTGL